MAPQKRPISPKRKTTKPSARVIDNESSIDISQIQLDVYSDAPTPLLDNKTKIQNKGNKSTIESCFLQSTSDDEMLFHQDPFWNGPTGTKNLKQDALFDFPGNNYSKAEEKNGSWSSEEDDECDKNGAGHPYCHPVSIGNMESNFSHDTSNRQQDVTKSRDPYKGIRSNMSFVIHNDTAGGHWTVFMTIVKGVETLEDDDDDDANISEEKMCENDENKQKLTVVADEVAREMPEIGDNLESEQIPQISEKSTQEKSTKKQLKHTKSSKLPPQDERVEIERKKLIRKDHSMKEKERIKKREEDKSKNNDKRKGKKLELDGKERPKLERQYSGQSLSQFVEVAFLKQPDIDQKVLDGDKKSRSKSDKAKRACSKSPTRNKSPTRSKSPTRTKNSTRSMSPTRRSKTRSRSPTRMSKRSQTKSPKRDSHSDAHDNYNATRADDSHAVSKSRRRDSLGEKHTSSSNEKERDNTINSDARKQRKENREKDTKEENRTVQKIPMDLSDKNDENKGRIEISSETQVEASNLTCDNIRNEPTIVKVSISSEDDSRQQNQRSSKPSKKVPTIENDKALLFDDEMSIDPLNGFVPHQLQHEEMKPILGIAAVEAILDDDEDILDQHLQLEANDANISKAGKKGKVEKTRRASASKESNRKGKESPNRQNDRSDRQRADKERYRSRTCSPKRSHETKHHVSKSDESNSGRKQKQSAKISALDGNAEKNETTSDDNQGKSVAGSSKDNDTLPAKSSQEKDARKMTRSLSSDDLSSRSDHAGTSLRRRVARSKSALDSRSDHSRPSVPIRHGTRRGRAANVVESPKKNHDSVTESSADLSPVFSVNQGIRYLNQGGTARHSNHKSSSHINDMSFAQLNFSTLGSDHSKSGAVKFVDNEEVAAAAEVELEMQAAPRLPLAEDDPLDIEVFDETTKDNKNWGVMSSMLTGKKPSISTNDSKSPIKQKNKTFFSVRSNTKQAEDAVAETALSPKKAGARTFSLLRGGKVASDGPTDPPPPTPGGSLYPFRKKDKSAIEETPMKEEKKKNRFFQLGNASTINSLEQSKIGMSYLADEDDDSIDS